MKRVLSSYVTSAPTRRPLRIYAIDPMSGKARSNRVTLDVPNEPPLTPGPVGERLEVIDYDGAHGRFYPPVDLNEPSILMQGGLAPTESDPRFHQQMVYAVAMKTLENFDFALGRPVSLRRGRFKPRLRLLPHAFYGANAFYDPDLHAVLFGYFRADAKDPGPNLPGQIVFTCLSHDIVVHEMTHAIVHRLRHYFLEPSNPDVLAFHEGFADIVALFQHFTYRDLLLEEIQRVRLDIRRESTLVKLAQQFGLATGTGRALRSALGTDDLRHDDAILEPHRRGSILVAAVFDAFYALFVRRTRDLIRIATGGSGELPTGDLHPDLVGRISAEAADTAQTTLLMCIRAFDYLPPVDITFGDFLRALVTADWELSPQDDVGRRAAFIEAFRARGLYATGVASLAEESLVWEDDPDVERIPMTEQELLLALMSSANAASRQPTSPKRRQSSVPESEESEAAGEAGISSKLASVLHPWAMRNRSGLRLDPNREVAVRGFHFVYRVAPDRRVKFELISQFTQHGDDDDALGGLRFRGGTTVVASMDGTVRYAIAKPLPSADLPEVRREALARLERQRRYVAALDRTDLMLSCSSQPPREGRMKARASFAALHGGL